MADTNIIKPFLCEGLDKALVSVEWEKWLRSFNLYLTVTGIEEAKKKRDRMLHFGGTQLQEVAYSLPDAVVDTAPEGDDVFQILVQKLIDYFSPAQNSTFERHVFRKIKPESEENFNKFLLRVRHAAKRCSFGKNETESSELNMKDLILDN
ncbi:hypothetical protein TKK_0017635 [Trichogramma kaykai]|uniref:Uncharacterized protein n=1 Tax=Trichogramma kaykai TaxID=54128 RepID=A0ABD2W231_9HYME